ncbi:MAG: hypothetical protein COB67_08555 [SAR324 cluster bacterium]|uniref:HTH LytTR-type domain-containing protein n=1 Tax=SAR324 cluster bacterium TaxID=2024889 RepID=A0A2A4T1W6_9DELT|nr:MAG: hypothetical protein COB67_08555 [SAR324 cluster bacterium]
MHFRWFLLSLLILLSSPLLFGKVAAAESIELTGKLSFLEDQGNKLKFEQVIQPNLSSLFQPSLTTHLNFGDSNQPYWLKLEPNLGDSEEGTYILEIQYGKIGIIELYYQGESGEWLKQKRGISIPARGGEVVHRNFIFILEASALKKPVYLKVQKGYLRLILHLWKLSEFTEKEQQAVFYDGLFYGAVMLVFLFNLFFYYFIRDRTLIYYSLFLLAIFFWYLSGQGWLDVFLPIRGTPIVRFQTAFWGVLLTIFGIQFTRSYLKLDTHSPGISRVLLFSQFFLPSISVSALIALQYYNQTPGRATFGIGLLLIILMLMLCLLAAVQGVREKREIAIYYFVATSLFIVLAIVQMLSSLQIFSTGLHWKLLQWGSVIEMLIFSLGLSRFYRQLQKEKYQMQVELVSTERKLVEQLEMVNELKDKILNNVIDPKLFPDLGQIASISGSILYVRAFGSSTQVYYQTGKNIKEMSLDCSLQNLRSCFGDDYLLKIHKSYLVNPKVPFSLCRRSSADYNLVFENHTLPVGRKFAKQIKEIFSGSNSIS